MTQEHAVAPRSLRVLRALWFRTPLGWMQLIHHKTRMAVAIGGVAFANLLILMQLGFMGALFETTVMIHRSFKADIVMTSSAARQLQNVGTLSRRRMLQAFEVEGVADAIPLYYGTLDWINPVTKKKASFSAIGVPPEADAFTNAELAGQLWKLKIPDTLLFDRRARGAWAELIRRVEAGETVQAEISGRTASVEGLFSQGASFGADGLVVVSDSTWLRFVPQRDAGLVSIVLIKVAQGHDPEAVAERLRRALPSEDTRILAYDRFIESEQSFLRSDSPIAFIFIFGSIMGVIVGGAIVYQILASDVNDHLAEYATFKAIGYSHGYLLGIVFEEASILAILGFIPGFAISLGLYELTQSALSMPMAMPLDRPFTVFGTTFLMCCISGALATRRLSAADPADVF